MSIPRPLKQLSKFLTYIFERNPYEFGIVPDEDGFVKIKELLKAINEEEGWRHIKIGNIEELIYTLPDPPVEIDGNRIRSTNPDARKAPAFAETLPKLLYTCIRTKAHFHVTHKGVHPPQDSDYVILSSEQEVAEKIGKRRDKAPVLLTINTDAAENDGVFFFHAGDTIYLARHIPKGCFSGPPLPEQQPAPKKPKKGPDKKALRPEPGSYFPEPDSKKSSKRDKLSWKENKKKLRKQKQGYFDDY